MGLSSGLINWNTLNKLRISCNTSLHIIQVCHKNHKALPCVHFCTVPLRTEQNLLFHSPSDQIRWMKVIGRRETGLRGCCDLSSTYQRYKIWRWAHSPAARKRARKRAVDCQWNRRAKFYSYIFIRRVVIKRDTVLLCEPARGCCGKHLFGCFFPYAFFFSFYKNMVPLLSLDGRVACSGW